MVKLQHKVPNVQECDATMPHQCVAARLQKMILKIFAQSILIATAALETITIFSCLNTNIIARKFADSITRFTGTCKRF